MEDTTSHSPWTSPLLGSFKANFDVTVRVDFVVATVVISDYTGDIIYAVTKRFFTQDGAVGEALATFLVTHAANLFGVDNLIFERGIINIKEMLSVFLIFFWCFFNNDVTFKFTNRLKVNNNNIKFNVNFKNYITIKKTLKIL